MTTEGDRHWDLVVIGAGPAGSAAALAALRADPTARVLMLDAAEFPRDKVCGDGIAPHAMDVLTGLDVDVDALVAGTAPVTTLRLCSPGGVEARRGTARPAYVVPRVLFDDRLVSAARAAGAVLLRHRVRRVDRVPGGVVVDGTIRARVVVGADGAESVTRRAAAAPRPRPGTVAVAVRGYTELDEWPHGEQLLVLARAHWPAYAWVFPIGDGRANVGYGELITERPSTRAQLEARLHALLPTNLHPASLRGHRLPLSSGRPRVSDGNVLLVGDALSLINPLTGEGIYYAVLSGALAGAAAVTAANPGRTYRRALARTLGSHLRTTDVLARVAKWPVLLDVGVAAARDRQAAFDGLVEIGLGAGTVGPATLASLAVAGLDRARHR